MPTHSHALPWFLIPAYQPAETLARVVDALIAGGAEHVVVVDDGSDEPAQPIFQGLEKLPQVTLLRHAVNLGKGAALRTGINHILLHAPDDLPGVVTVDADGQHDPADALTVAREGVQRGGLVLGARSFEGSVPLRSRIGNVGTRNVFRLFVGKGVTDTQTGLRFVPRAFLPHCLTIESSGYDFELEMLLRAVQRGVPLTEVPIKTVYFGANEHSHFSPVLDSLKIYFVFLRFLSASLVTAGLDYLVFSIVFALGGSLLGSFIGARLVAGTFNFCLVKVLVFKSRREVLRELPKFALTVAGLMLVSYWLTGELRSVFGGYVLPAKALAEGMLFLVSFTIQRFLIFGVPAEKETA